MCNNGTKSPKDINSILQRFRRHLSDSSEVHRLSEEFGALPSNSERVDFAFKLLNKYNVKAEFVKDEKNDEISSQLRQKGNEFYKKKSLWDAWECYTKSAAFAEMNSPNLGLAYANRSAVLAEVNKHEECLIDIDRALNSHYPENLKEKLTSRRRTSGDLLKSRIPENFHEPIPTLAEKNPNIQSAANCIKVNVTQSMGRYIIATRDIPAGEVIAVEKPFVSLLVDQKLCHCHECLQLCYNPLPCEICTNALYCSETCRRSAHHYHQHECSILSSLYALKLDALKMLPLKIAMIASNKLPINDINSETMYHSDRYKEIHELVTNAEKRSVSDLFERAIVAGVIYTLVKDHTKYFDGNVEVNFKELLLLHMQTGPSNFHEISELAPNADGFFVPEEVGSGAFSLLSLFNHSCSPNVVRHSYGSTIVVRAFENIKEGEQCCDNYGYHHATVIKSERQKQLKSQYYFDCICQACEENWGLYADLPSEDDSEIDEEIISLLSSAHVQTAKTILPDFLSNLTRTDKSRPNKNHCQIQEVVKQCLAILANKRRAFQ